MRYLAISQAYTITTFGASFFMWPLIPAVPPVPPWQGAPLWLTHPYLTMQLFLIFSAAIVLAAALLASLYELQEDGESLTRSISENLSTIVLALVTVIVCILGVVTYSEPMYLAEPSKNDLI